MYVNIVIHSVIEDADAGTYWWFHSICECMMLSIMPEWMPVYDVIASFSTDVFVRCCYCCLSVRMPLHGPLVRLHRKLQVSDPGMHHGTCVRHTPWCMSGSLTRHGGIPGAYETLNFTYLTRGPWCNVLLMVSVMKHCVIVGVSGECVTSFSVSVRLGMQDVNSLRPSDAYMRR